MQDNVLSVSKVRYAVPGFSHTDGELSAELAALAVLEAFYREDIAWPVPQCDRITVDGKKMKLHFTACVGGLLKGRRDIEGFEIQDANGKWGRANAEIAGDTVIVSSDDIPNPVRVRLSPVHRRSRHEEYELWNKAGFPVEPFDLSVNSKP